MKEFITFKITFSYQSVHKVDVVHKKFENHEDAERWAEKEQRKRKAKDYWVS